MPVVQWTVLDADWMLDSIESETVFLYSNPVASEE